MKIRRAEEKDILKMAEIEERSFSVPWSFQSMWEACQSEGGISLVCEQDDEIVGYCLMWTSLDEGNITNVAVDKNHRNKGYGRALMKTLETCGLERGIRNFYLEVRKSNESAIRMYQNAGYKPVGLRKNFYEKPAEDAIIMAKIFKE